MDQPAPTPGGPSSPAPGSRRLVDALQRDSTRSSNPCGGLARSSSHPPHREQLVHQAQDLNEHMQLPDRLRRRFDRMTSKQAWANPVYRRARAHAAVPTRPIGRVEARPAAPRSGAARRVARTASGQDPPPETQSQ